jgi:GDP-4-dehydro-6-deoxy-D-mannose reductase
MTDPVCRALVTGASGFLGQHVLAELAARGIETWSLGRRCPVTVGPERHIVLASVLDVRTLSDSLRRVAPSIVLHLAGTATAPLAEMYEANTIFAANLLSAAASIPTPPRVFLAGTAAEYGPVSEIDLPVTEQTPAAPRDAYGISKLAQTYHGLSAAERGLGVVVGRIFNAVGPGMPEHLALGSFAAQIHRLGPAGGVLETGDLDVERDFVEVSDVAALAVDLAMRTDVTGIVHLSSGVPTSLRQLVEGLLRYAGKPVELRRVAGRRGITSVRRHYGLPVRLGELGLRVPTFDADRAAASLTEALPPSTS